MKPYVDYREGLLKRLRKDPEHAMGYLNECLQDENSGVFLLALKDVADAYGGLKKLAKKTKLNREHLFRMLSKNGNPRLDTLKTLADAFGWKLTFVEKGRSRLRRAA